MNWTFFDPADQSWSVMCAPGPVLCTGVAKTAQAESARRDADAHVGGGAPQGQ